MKRRDFITLLGGAAATWPLAARAQPRAMPVIGFLHAGSPSPVAPYLAEFRRALAETSYVENQNVAIEYRYADGQCDRLPELAGDLIRRRVTVVVTAPSANAARAAKAATSAIPIVFMIDDDPVKFGLVAGLNRPGGNATGFMSFDVSVSAKWLELLKEIAPRLTRVAVLRDLTIGPAQLSAIQAVAPSLGVELRPIDTRDAEQIEHAVVAFASEPNGGLIAATGGGVLNHRELIVALAARHRLPAIYAYREHVISGGLMSYGLDNLDQFRRAAGYVDRVLKGEKPADLPVQAPTKYELVINLKTAKATGLEVPPTLLACADEVIE